MTLADVAITALCAAPALRNFCFKESKNFFAFSFYSQDGDKIGSLGKPDNSFCVKTRSYSLTYNFSIFSAKNLLKLLLSC